MLCRGTLKSVGRLINVGRALGFIPFQYSSDDNAVTYDGSKGLGARIRLNYLLLAFYQVFLLAQCLFPSVVFKRNGDKEVRSEVKVTTVYLTGLFFLFNYNHVVVMESYEDYVNLTNAVFRMAAGYRNVGDLSSKRDKFGKIVKLCAFAFGFATVMRSVGILKNPASGIFLTSLAARPELLDAWRKVAVGLVQLEIFAFHYYMMILNVVLAILHVFAISEFLQEKMVRGGGDGVERKVYVELSVLQRHWNTKYGHWIFVGQVGSMLVVMVRLFEAIVVDSVRSLVVALSFLLILFPTFRKFAHVHQLSCQVLRSWRLQVVHLQELNNRLRNGGRGKNSSLDLKELGVGGGWSRLKGAGALEASRVRLLRGDATEWKWLRRFQKSCSPINVVVGSFFYVDSSFVLTILAIIIVNTNNLVLTYREAHSG